MSQILISIILSFFVGQTIKLALHHHQYRRFNLWTYFEDGGMPSVHSTVLFALLTSLFYDIGVTPLSVACALFTVIILNDTMKVRRQQGVQPELMARFIDLREVFRRKLTESIGHTPEQVFVGALVGILVTSIVYVL